MSNKNHAVVKGNKKENKTKKSKKMSKKKLIVTCIITLFLAFIMGLVIHLNYKADIMRESYEFEDGEAARIGDTSISMEEFMLYSMDVKEGYELQYGEDIWDTITTDVNGKMATFETVAKEDTFEQIRLVKSLCKKAEDLKISLSDEEKEALKRTADDYYKTLDEAGITDEGMTDDVIYKFYKENYLAQKIYYKLTKGSDLLSDTNGLVINENVNSTEQSENEQSNESKISDEEIAKIWSEVIKEYYPTFDYEIDINWDLVDALRFSSSENLSDEISELQSLDEFLENQDNEEKNTEKGE